MGAGPQTPLSPYLPQVAAAAAQYNVPPEILASLLTNESGNGAGLLDPRKATVGLFAVSPTGAQGLAQFEPATAAGEGLANPFDPAQAIPAAAKYLRQQYDGIGVSGNWDYAIAAYNAGYGAVTYKGVHIPQNGETPAYVKNVDATATLFAKSPELFGSLAGVDPSVTNPVSLTGNQITRADGRTGITWNPFDPNYWKQTADPKGTLTPDAQKTVAAINDPAATLVTGAKQIALEVFVGGLAIALIAGGIAWLAAIDGAKAPGIKATI